MKPIRAIHLIATWLVLAIGVVHTVGTFFFHSDLSEAAIWFAGAGLGGIFIAFLNMGLWHTASPSLSRVLVGVANVVFMGWLAAGIAATPGPPQALILAIGGTMALCGLVLARSETGRGNGGDGA
jgi:hypothetical protein